MTHFFIQNKSLLTSTFGHPRPFTYVGKHQHLATQEPLKKWMGRSQELHNFKQGLLNLDGRNCQKYLHQTWADLQTLIISHNCTQSL